MGLGLEGGMRLIQMKSSGWKEPHEQTQENRVSSENLALGLGAMDRNLEGQVWVNLGRTEKTMEPEYK